MRNSPILFCALILTASVSVTTPSGAVGPRSVAGDREIAANFAPIFYQALGDKPRSDYISNFDFDGDWRGDNNWKNVDNKKFALKAHVYYAVAETTTHFFIHYAVFHPRDYKGGEVKGKILSELMREGARRGGKYDPTGIAQESSLAHENDMEGCLLVIEKPGVKNERPQVKYVETFSHNDFSRYAANVEYSDGLKLVRLNGQRPLLYIEPKGHGITALDDDKLEKKNVVVYEFVGNAEDPTKKNTKTVGYELVDLKVLWDRARSPKNNVTYGEFHDYGILKINIHESNGKISERKVNVGSLGASFLGNVGGVNMGRPPWGWASRDKREERGLWFLDPATVVKRDFNLGETFTTAYIHPPFWARGQ